MNPEEARGIITMATTTCQYSQLHLHIQLLLEPFHYQTHGGPGQPHNAMQTFHPEAHDAHVNRIESMPAQTTVSNRDSANNIINNNNNNNNDLRRWPIRFAQRWAILSW